MAEAFAKSFRILCAQGSPDIKAAVGAEGGGARIAGIGADAAAAVLLGQCLSQEEDSGFPLTLRTAEEREGRGRRLLRDGIRVQGDAVGGKELHQLFLRLAAGAVLGGLAQGESAQQEAVHQNQDDNNDIFQQIPVQTGGLLLDAYYSANHWALTVSVPLST